MTDSDKELIIDLWHKDITEAVFRDHFRGDLTEPQKYFVKEFAESYKTQDGDALEHLLLLIELLKIDSREFVPVLADILTTDWHVKHEDIVRKFEELKDPRTIDALFNTANKTFSYLDYDDSFGLARRCTWALAKIGTDEALDRLRVLSQSDNSVIAEYAEKRLKT